MKLIIKQGGSESSIKAAGICILLVAGSAFMIYQEIDEGTSPTALYVLGGFFALLAVIAIFFKRITKFDRTKNEIETSLNLLGLAIRSVDKLDEARKVEFVIGEKVNMKQVGSSHVARITYTINMIYENDQGEVRLHVFKSGNEEKARNNLKRVSDFMSMEPIEVDHRDEIQKASAKAINTIFK